MTNADPHFNTGGSITIPVDVDSKLAQCWDDVEDGSPTLNQHWFTSLVCVASVHEGS